MIKLLLMLFIFAQSYDTVPAYGLAQNNDMENLSNFDMSLDVTNSAFKTIVHAVAVNENRYQFSRRSIYTDSEQAKSHNGVVQENGKYRLEKGFLGAHSDIGGGYANGDLSNASLMWMIKQAEEKGNIQFDKPMIDIKQYNQINDPIVHDSVWDMPFLYTMGSQFRWANDSSKGFDKTSIFNNFEHLGLNWNDTKVFQNPNHKQFDDVEKITKLYLKSPDAQYAIYPTMLANPWTYAQHYRYVKLKDDGVFSSLADMAKGADNVLMAANNKSKAIALRDYLKWLKCSYHIDISTKRDKDDFISNLTEQQLCNGKPLQSYLPIETKKQGVNGWIAFLMMLGLFGCVSSSKTNSQKTQLELILRSQQGNSDKGITPILKVSPTLKSKCDISGNNIAQYFGTACHRLENYDALTIEYAIIPRLQNRQADEQSYINQHAQSLPPSAWRTYTLNTKPIMEEMNRIYHADPDPKWTYRNGIQATVTLYIDGNGNITQEVKYSSVVGWVFT